MVRRLLHELGYSLQANAKTTEGAQHPDRDAQFGYLNDQADQHLDAGDPVISVDTKKKELVGAYKNGGRECAPAGQPEQVKVHDFIDPDLGKANPYGVYDIAADAGWVSVGTDHDTAAFAVATIGRWWDTVGGPPTRAATRLLICADGGGSNGYRTRLWKTELAALAAGTGLTDHRLPPPARHLQVEQDRAPAVLPHLDELARPAPDQPRSHRQHHRRHHHPHRPDRARRTRHHRYPTGVKIPDDAMESPHRPLAPSPATTSTASGTTRSTRSSNTPENS